MKNICFALVFLLPSFVLKAQTFYNTGGGSIPDNNTYVSFPIVTSALPNNINTTNFGVEKVEINISHPATGDLRIKLESPDGSEYVLTSFAGGTGNNYTNTVFTDTASATTATASAPFSGYFHPVDALSWYNNGQDPNGTWNLNIRDANTGNMGSVISWSITFSNNPAGSVNFASSNLPLVMIHTNNQTIADGTPIVADMGIIYNGPGIRNYKTDPWNHYNGKIAIEIRGQSSTWFPQKQYNVETQFAGGLENNVSIFSMPLEHDWVLYAPYTDKFLMRNVLTYKLARDMGRWAARTRFCEVLIDSVYKGLYVFMEKIKRDTGRVSIKKMLSTDNTGDNVSGGYIFSIDKDPEDWFSPIPPNNSTAGQSIGFHYVYPKVADITAQQSAYLQAYVDSFEQALNSPNFQDPLTGYRKYASVKSFADYFILNEISNNVDGYRLSTFLHKDRNSKGGQLKAGPHWDYNLAWHNADYCNGDRYDVWAYQFNTACPGDYWQIPFWWDKLVTDSAFQNTTYCRWQQLRAGILDTVNLFAQIDSMANEVDEAQQRHFTAWPILGTYVWPNPSPLANTYAEEVRNTKDWIINRIKWLDSAMIGSGPCAPLDVSVSQNKKIIGITAYPNPFNDQVSITTDFPKQGNYQIELYDITGKKLSTIAQDFFEQEAFTYVLNLKSLNLMSGIFVLRISGEGLNKSILLNKQ